MKTVDFLALAIGTVALVRLLGSEPEADPFERRADARMAKQEAVDGVRFLSRPYDDAKERRSGPGMKGSLVR